VLFATAAQWAARLAEAHHAGRLQNELTRLGRYPLLVIDEVGYIPFEAEAANLLFQLVSAATSAPCSSSPATSPVRWGEVFGDEGVAAAMIDNRSPPRRRHRPQRRLLPPQEPGPRPGPLHYGR
jgi:DNA replication protein DnaC